MLDACDKRIDSNQIRVEMHVPSVLPTCVATTLKRLIVMTKQSSMKTPSNSTRWWILKPRCKYIFACRRVELFRVFLKVINIDQY